MATLTLPGSCAAQVTAKDNADGWGREKPLGSSLEHLFFMDFYL